MAKVNFGSPSQFDAKTNTVNLLADVIYFNMHDQHDTEFFLIR